MAQAILMSSITRATGLPSVVLPRSSLCTAVYTFERCAAAVQVPWWLEQAAAGQAAACPLQSEEDDDAAAAGLAVTRASLVPLSSANWSKTSRASTYDCVLVWSVTNTVCCP